METSNTTCVGSTLTTGDIDNLSHLLQKGSGDIHRSTFNGNNYGTVSSPTSRSLRARCACLPIDRVTKQAKERYDDDTGA